MYAPVIMFSSTTLSVLNGTWN